MATKQDGYPTWSQEARAKNAKAAPDIVSGYNNGRVSNDVSAGLGGLGSEKAERVREIARREPGSTSSSWPTWADVGR